MITLYTAATPNGRKASIMLEEMGLEYRVKPINIGANEQFTPEFLAVSPNNKIPAIVDEDAPGGPLSIFESGAILVYLAEKTGKLLAPSGAARFKALEWTFWQVGGLGPMLGQLGFFVMRSKDKPPEAIERFTTESHRLFAVMNGQLGKSEFLAGADYTIADVASYAWTLGASTLLKAGAPGAWGDFPHIDRWLKAVGERPAVVKGMAVPAQS
jgi:GST-like protein